MAIVGQDKTVDRAIDPATPHGEPVAARRAAGQHDMESTVLDSKPADRADQQSEDVRQGTGPRATVPVLLVSLLLAVAAGMSFVIYFGGLR